MQNIGEKIKAITKTDLKDVHSVFCKPLGRVPKIARRKGAGCWIHGRCMNKVNKRVSVPALPPLSNFYMASRENVSILLVEAITQVFNYTSTPAPLQVRRSHPARETPQAPVRTIWSLLLEKWQQQRLTLVLVRRVFKCV